MGLLHQKCWEQAQEAYEQFGLYGLVRKEMAILGNALGLVSAVEAAKIIEQYSLRHEPGYLPPGVDTPRSDGQCTVKLLGKSGPTNPSKLYRDSNLSWQLGSLRGPAQLIINKTPLPLPYQFGSEIPKVLSDFYADVHPLTLPEKAAQIALCPTATYLIVLGNNTPRNTTLLENHGFKKLYGSNLSESITQSQKTLLLHQVATKNDVLLKPYSTKPANLPFRSRTEPL